MNNTELSDYQAEFINYAITCGALCFGEYRLKSGRNSPYFFNAGLFNTGRALEKLGECYAHAIKAEGFDYDLLFGPAYKGIPLVSATAISLSKVHSIDVPYAFNRKEKKAHGEGGSIVGSAISGKVLIIDDVITAGTAINEAVTIIQELNAEVAGVVVAVDRQEKGAGDISAIDEVRQKYRIPVRGIVTLDQIIQYLSVDTKMDLIADRMSEYREKYGAA